MSLPLRSTPLAWCCHASMFSRHNAWSSGQRVTFLSQQTIPHHFFLLLSSPWNAKLQTQRGSCLATQPWSPDLYFADIVVLPTGSPVSAEHLRTCVRVNVGFLVTERPTLVRVLVVPNFFNFTIIEAAVLLQTLKRFRNSFRSLSWAMLPIIFKWMEVWSNQDSSLETAAHRGVVVGGQEVLTT